jgi:hypothetical protein
MKRKELYDIEKELQTVKITGTTVAFVIADNKKRISEAIQKMEKQTEQSSELKQHIKDVEDLKRKYSEKDHIGRPKLKPGNYPDGSKGMFYTIVGSEEPENDFRKALTALEVKNSVAILEHEEKERIYREVYLEEETDFQLRTIKYSALPKDITQDQMDALMIILDYDVTDPMKAKKDGK